jgi:hypothetical protein
MHAFLAAAMFSASWAMPGVPELPEVANLEISLSRGIVDARPVVRVAITNQSQFPLCIRTEALQNPESGEMQVSMRDPFGNALRYRHGGFIDPPMRGTTRVRPGETIRVYDFLSSRFLLPNNGVPFPEGMTAQVSFHYGYCDDVWSLDASSTWQAI